MGFKQILAWIIRMTLMHKRLVALFAIALAVVQFLMIIFMAKSSTSKASIVDTDFINKIAFDVKFNPDLNVICNSCNLFICIFNVVTCLLLKAF